MMLQNYVDSLNNKTKTMKYTIKRVPRMDFRFFFEKTENLAHQKLM
jgi:hypothetical protein